MKPFTKSPDGQPHRSHSPTHSHFTQNDLMIAQLARSKEKRLGFKLSGKLTDEDYKHFVPAIDAAIAFYGKVRILAEFDNFHGWDLHALWDDLKFTSTHFSAIERIALVADTTEKDWMSAICKPFTAAEVRSFTRTQLGDAWDWLESTMPLAQADALQMLDNGE